MDKLIHTHLNNRMDIQESASAAALAAVDQIDFKSLLADPQAELARVAQEAMVSVYTFTQEAAHEGLRFADAVKKKDQEDKKVVFVDSNNPELNKGEL